MINNDSEQAQALDLNFRQIDTFTDEEKANFSETGFPSKEVTGKKEFFGMLFFLLVAAISAPFLTLYVVNIFAGFGL